MSGWQIFYLIWFSVLALEAFRRYARANAPGGKMTCYTGQCGGYPVTKHDEMGRLWVGWKCAECGIVKHAEIARW